MQPFRNSNKFHKLNKESDDSIMCGFHLLTTILCCNKLYLDAPPCPFSLEIFHIPLDISSTILVSLNLVEKTYINFFLRIISLIQKYSKLNFKFAFAYFCCGKMASAEGIMTNKLQKEKPLQLSLIFN